MIVFVLNKQEPGGKATFTPLVRSSDTASEGGPACGGALPPFLSL
jgi:hypothetical protein